MNGEEQLQLRSWIEQVQLKDHVATSTRDPNVGSALDKLQKGQSLDDAQAKMMTASARHYVENWKRYAGGLKPA